MRGSTLVSSLMVLVTVVSAGPVDGDGGVCATAGKICGDARCVPQDGGLYFTCDCGKDQYFNATSQRCYHVRSCIPQPCSIGICRDDDGKSASTCDCSHIKHMTRDCKVETAFHETCGKYPGSVYSDEGGRIMCRCPPGMKFNGYDCESFACAVSSLTCKEICDYKPYMEDKRCCQGWDDSCSAHHEENTYCKPGTIPAGENGNNLNCTNVCAVGKSPCEYDCTYEDRKSPHYTCKCPDGEELNPDGYTCGERKACAGHEESECKKKGQRCVIEERQAVCKCFPDQILLKGKCHSSCTDSKEFTCTSALGQCKIIDNVETCVCDKPFTWDEVKKKCILEKQFIYDVQFELYQKPNADRSDSQEQCETMALSIEHAMKNLYGKGLRTAWLTQCGNTSVVEMNFAEVPDQALLNRIHQCQKLGPVDECFFAPNLYIVKGTATAPTGVDICTRYLNAFDVVVRDGLKCYNDGNGDYTLRCDRKTTLPSAKHGALTVVQCEGQSTCTEEKYKECEKIGLKCVVKNNEPSCEKPDVPTAEKPSREHEEHGDATEPTEKPHVATTEIPSGGPNSAQSAAPLSAVFLLGILIPALVV